MKRFICDNQIRVFLKNNGYAEFYVCPNGAVWALDHELRAITRIGWIA